VFYIVNKNKEKEQDSVVDMRMAINDNLANSWQMLHYAWFLTAQTLHKIRLLEIYEQN
jgi:hypothetical protein